MTRLEFEAIDQLVDFTERNLLYSQDRFLHNTTHREQCLVAGVGSGKTLILCAKAILLSYLTEDNYGLLGRDTATSLSATTMQDFFDLLPGTGAIGSPTNMLIRHDRKDNIAYIRTAAMDAGMSNKSSAIAFRHMNETRPGSKHLSGLNLAWFGVDQLEDCDQTSWEYVLGTRLRRTNIPYHCGFGIANTKGKDWVYKRFFKECLEAQRVQKHMLTGYAGADIEIEEYESADKMRWALRSPSLENIHLPKGFIESILKNQTKEYIERYVHASFEEWGGKVYKGFGQDSCHVIHPFPVPDHWPCMVGIDVGGDVPWGIVTIRVDPSTGDLFVTNEFYKASVLISEIVGWIRNKTLSGIPNPARTRFIIDPENKSAMLELGNEKIFCEGAHKANKYAGILRVAGYLQPKLHRKRVIENQPRGDGLMGPKVVSPAPHLWVFRTCENWIREHEEWQWDRDKRTGESLNRPVDKADHLVDSTLYVCRVRPLVEELPNVNPDLELLRKIDVISYNEAKYLLDLRKTQTGRRVADMWNSEVGSQPTGEAPGTMRDIWR